MNGCSGALPTVLDSAKLHALADRLRLAAEGVDDAMTQATDRWRRMSEVFDVRGAQSAHHLLDRPARSAESFVEALAAARTRLTDAADAVFPDLQRRRDILAARVASANERYDDALRDAAEAEARYVRENDADARSAAALTAASRRMAAWDARTTTEAALGELDAEIARLRHDVEQAEDDLASGLRAISGGDEVSDAWGARVGVSQDYWGGMRAAYPGGPGSPEPLADRLTRSLSDASAERISWMGRADRDDVRRWVERHPDFASAVGLIDPGRARRLWMRFDPAALVQLFTVAPFAVGNLNGIPSTTRDDFNRESLSQMLADDALSDEHREQLRGLTNVLDDDPRPLLLSLFAETDDDSPRASIGWGDVDSADQITTLTHGIHEDLGKLPAWAGSAETMQEAVSAHLAAPGSSATTATVMFMEWDSGSMFNVLNIERPDNGAVRLARLLHGFRAQSPGVQLDLGLHSLGTTAGTQMIAEHPGLVSNAWLYGSAGISERTARELARQMSAGQLAMHATIASGTHPLGGDWIAPLGRLGEHPVDPARIPGTQTFSSDGGVVGDSASDEPAIVARGAATGGHNVQRSDLPFYRIDPAQLALSPVGALLQPWEPPSVGYLDPASQSFRQSVMDIADGVAPPREGTQ